MDIEREKCLVPNNETRTCKSRAFEYRIPKTSKDVFKLYFFPRSIGKWISLPPEIANSSSLQSFKTNLVNYYK